jgi:hypothetical protein
LNDVTIAPENIYKERSKIMYSPSFKKNKFFPHRTEQNSWKSVSVGEKPVPVSIFHDIFPQEMARDRNGSFAMIDRHLTALSHGMAL